jgi:hypothetical protein
MSGKPERLQDGIQIKWPLAWIIGAGLLLYIRSIGFGFTDLDDRIFIFEFKPLLSKLSNLPSLFRRGVFNETKDVYYRPMLMVSFMLDAQVAGTSPRFYHVMNVFLHLFSVYLFYLLLLRLNIKSLTAFLLALIFAVHPVLCQAVVWIPGRNDTLLAVFVLSSMLFFIKYLEHGKPFHILLHIFFLFLSLLTKETAVIIPFICLSFFLFIKRERKPDSVWIYVVPGWIFALAGWYVLRSSYTISKPGVLAGMVSGITEKCYIFLGYLGKIFLPYNLSVFPIAEDTSVISGLLVFIILAVLIYFSKDKNPATMLFGFSWFILFLLPVLIIPHDINGQIYEHRLYLPLMGIMIAISQTFLFNNSRSKTVLISCIALALLFAGINYNQAEKFKSEMVFWKNAVKDSPHSSYALVRLGSRYYTKGQKESAEQCFASSLAINPDEKYANYYLGKVYLEKGKATEGYKLLMKEDSLNPGYVDNLFELAHACFMLDKKQEAMKYLISYSGLRPDDPQAHNNLYLLYLEKKDYANALKEARELKRLGIPDAARMIAAVEGK